MTALLFDSTPVITCYHPFRFGARSKSGKVKLRRQHRVTVAICGDGGRVVAQDYRIGIGYFEVFGLQS